MNGKSQLFVRALPLCLAMSGVMSTVFLASCNNNQPPSDAQLQQQAAQATETAKQDSKEALAQARVAAQQAEEKVNAVAAGVKEGMQSNNAPAGGGTRMDLNSASQADLTSLPGISPGKASQIIDHRPYTSSHDLVKDGLLSESQFDAIAPKVTVQ
jgi:DNA uptake protein ComE-like DNA-binding protein